MNQQSQVENSVFSAINSLPQNGYVPSSVEKKRALMMYFLFGIIMVISNKKANEFEFFHLKQSLGWWMLFVLSVLLSAVAIFIPIIKYLIIFWLTIVMSLFVIFARQAWIGKYYLDDSKYALGLFPSLGSWLFGLFNMGFDGSDLVGSSSDNKLSNISRMEEGIGLDYGQISSELSVDHDLKKEIVDSAFDCGTNLDNIVGGGVDIGYGSDEVGVNNGLNIQTSSVQSQNVGGDSDKGSDSSRVDNGSGVQSSDVLSGAGGLNI